MDIKDKAILKWGLAGYGDLAGKRVAPALREASDSQLKGVWGRDLDRTSHFAQQQQIPVAHRTFDALLRSDIDAVYVCTPPDSHAEYTLAAIAAGKHVLVEKPMATTVAQCESMTRAARLAGVCLGVAYYRRAIPRMRRIKHLIEKGFLGVPLCVNIASYGWFNPSADDPKHWRVEKVRSCGGGTVADTGVHRLDLLDYWLGPSRVAYTRLQHLVHSYEVEDGSSIALELDNGAAVHAYFAWSSKIGLDRFEILGSEGKILLDPLDSDSLILFRGAEREELSIEPPRNVHLPCAEDFVAAVMEGRPPLCDGEAGLRTNRLLADILAWHESGNG